MKRLAALGVLFVSALVPTSRAGADITSVNSNIAYSETVTCATDSYSVRANATGASASGGLQFAIDSTDAPGTTTVRTGPISINPAAGNVKSSTFGAVNDAYTFVLSDTSAAVGPAPIFVKIVQKMDACPRYLPDFGATYSPITPRRALDTRSGAGQTGYSGAKPAAGALLNLPLTGFVPVEAVAVALNVTAVETTGAGFVQVVPKGANTIGQSSNINAVSANQTIANSVISPIGADRSVSLYTAAGTHLLADVVGYFQDTWSGQTSGRYRGLGVPTRVLDTRSSSPKNYSGPSPAAGSSVTASVLGLGLPAGQVSAAIVNVTAVNAQPGFVQVAAGGALVPGATSSLNVEFSGQTIPNMVVAPVSAAGTIEIYSAGGGDLLVDVIGLFTGETTPAPANNGGRFHALTPERVLDTRLDFATNWTITDQGGKPVAGQQVPIVFRRLPNTTAAVLSNITATDVTAAGFIQAAARATLTPGASSNLNPVGGQTIANSAVVPVDSQKSVAVFTQSGTHLAVDLAGYFTI